MNRLPSVLCALTVAVLGMAGCAGSSPKPASDAPPVPVTAPVQVKGVSAGPGAESVTVSVTAQTGASGCSADARIDGREETGKVVYATVVQDTTGTGCPSFAPAKVVLTAEKPLGNRLLSINQQVWVRRNGAYTLCGSGKKCEVPPGHCDPDLAQDVVAHMDVSRHSRGNVESCDGTWMVMTVPDDPDACGVGGRPGCQSNARVRRYFLRYEGDGWATVARTAAGGCDDVLKAAPTFPRSECAGLAPLA
ncbi:hypothetical protein [Actinoplanes sp. NPDC051411]|uniref:hypothetical protein n=1 Tax=Actinoplanes sp. NPDC051411 TaxID=3155522 RepID=UPI00343D8BD7